MPIEVVINDNYTNMIFRGKISFKELVELAREYFSIEDTPNLLLIDYRLSELPKATAKEIEQVTIDVHAAIGATPKKMAHVFSRPVDFGLNRQYAAYSSILKKTYEIGTFYSIEEAREWLGI